MYNDLSTPCYVVDEETFAENIILFQKTLKHKFSKGILGYSFKTNALPYIINVAKNLGAYAEVVSDSEYRLALRAGYSPNNIIFNGPVKGRDSFRMAFKENSIINVDSWNELKWLKELSDDNEVGRVGIRVNFDVEHYLPGQTLMGEEGGRFGFSYETGELGKAIQYIRTIQNVTLAGLHMHISSRTKSKQVFECLAEMACQIVKEEHLDLDYIDIGGGFFGGNDGGQAYIEYLDAIHKVLLNNGLQDICLIVEPGASVIATAVDYVTNVVEVKETNRNRFVVTDGSRLHIDPFFHKTRYDFSISGAKENKVDRQIICGYTCMEGDRLMELEEEVELQEGSKIVYHICGAYTLGFNSCFINGLPTVYCKDDKGYHMVREMWDVEEYIQKCKWDV